MRVRTPLNLARSAICGLAILQTCVLQMRSCVKVDCDAGTTSVLRSRFMIAVLSNNVEAAIDVQYHGRALIVQPRQANGPEIPAGWKRFRLVTAWSAQLSQQYSYSSSHGICLLVIHAV